VRFFALLQAKFWLRVAARGGCFLHPESEKRKNEFTALNQDFADK
jgi:hypothetical protein